MKFYALFFVIATLVACGDIETTVDPDAVEGPVENASPDDLFAIRSAAGAGFGEESYGVGAAWYDYDDTTHVLTPKLRTYFFRSTETYTAIELTSYYDPQGKSGLFSLRTRHRKGEEPWSSVESVQMETNVKDEFACVGLAPFRGVACEEADLVFRTVRRPVPGAGFVVLNPAVFTTYHRALGVEQDSRWSSDGVEDAEWSEASPLRSVALEPRYSRIGWLAHEGVDEPFDDLNLHVTAEMQLVAWRVDEVEHAESSRVRLRAYCSEGDITEVGFPQEPTLHDVDLDGDYQMALVKLCEGATSAGVVSTYDAPITGLWPDTRGFDLILERGSEGLVLRLAPGNLHWNWTLGPGDGSNAIESLDPLLIERALLE